MKTKSIVLSFVFGLLAAAACAATASAAPSRQPLELTDVLTMRRFAWHAPITLSADGQLVAYVVSRHSERLIPEGVVYTATGVPRTYASTDVWLTDIASGKTRDLTGGAGTSWAATWSPDGRTLAFCSDRDGIAGLWLWDRESDALRRVGELVPRASWMEWSADSRSILIGVLPEGSAPLVANSTGNDQLTRVGRGGEPPGPTVQIFRSEPSATGGSGTQNIGTKRYASDLALIDVATGKVDRLARDVSLTKTVFSPDGRHVAFSEITGDNVKGTHIQHYTLKVFSLDSRESKMLVPPAEMGRWGSDFSWSPDSRTLAYRLGHESGEVHLVSLSGTSRPVTTAKHPAFKGVPAWDGSGKLLLLAEDAMWTVSATDGSAREIARLPGKTMQMLVPVTRHGDRPWLRDGGRSVVAIVSEGIKRELYRVRLDRGGADLLLAEQKDFTGVSRYNVLASPAIGRIVYAAEDVQHPEDLWITDSKVARSTRLTQLNPKISAIPMGALRVIEWTGSDGLPYAGALVLPSGYEPGKRYPLVTYVYPMDVLQTANRFGANHLGNEHFNLQLFATRGYAALYSGATLRPANREPMKAVADAVLPGVDRVIELGIADPKRIGVYGVSAGGYSTLALIVQSTRFKVAMAQAGAGNLLSLYGDLRDSGYSHGVAFNENSIQMANHPWGDRDRYIRNSPWFFLDKVETPLLLIHGTDDTAAIVNQSNEVFLGLRRLGKAAQYARYVGEGHGFTSLPNRLDAGERFLEWFDRHLGPGRAE